MHSVSATYKKLPNREGSKLQSGQISSVALMDARSIAATAANKGFLTSAADVMDREYKAPKYHFDKSIYANRVFDSKVLQIQVLRFSLDQTSKTGRQCQHYRKIWS